MVDVKELRAIANVIESDYEMDVEAKRIRATANELESLRKQIAEKDAIVERLNEALTPSSETKAAYHGEFTHEIEESDGMGGSLRRDVMVPWTTVKEIMAAIQARAAAEASAAGGTVDA